MPATQRTRPLPSPGSDDHPERRLRGLSIARGAFSDPLVSEVDSTTTSDLRSLTEHMPLPPPTPAARPRAPSQTSTTASAILLPPSSANGASSSTSSIPRPRFKPNTGVRTRSRAAPPGATTTTTPSLTVNTPAPLMRDGSPELSVTVNPVEALTKKLREQASELSSVYEQMERKEGDVDRLESEVKDLRLQLDEHKKQRQMSLKPSNDVSGAPTKAKVVKPHATTTKSSSVRRASATKSAPPSRAETSQSLTVASTSGQTDVVAAAINRFETAVDEIKTVHHRLLNARDADSDNNDERIREQRLYVRVLEEAVHLKASELHITGHEELLVVLAELRHTVYEQEREIHDLQTNLAGANEKLSHQQTLYTDSVSSFREEKASWESKEKGHQDREAKLQHQLEESQRLLHSEHLRFRQEQAAQVENTRLLERFREEIRAKSRQLHDAEEKLGKIGEEKSIYCAEVASFRTQLESEQRKRVNAEEELDRTLRQLDEVKALQEGLLASIDKFVEKEDVYETQVSELKTQLEASSKDLNAANAAVEQLECLQGEYNRLLSAKNASDEAATKWQQLERVIKLLQESAHSYVLDSREYSDKIQPHVLSRFRNLVQVAMNEREGISTIPCVVDIFEIFEGFCDSIEETSASWERERGDLIVAHRELQLTMETTEAELSRLQALVIEKQAYCVDCELKLEEARLRAETLEIQLQEARAQDNLQHALSGQIREQERLLQTQQKHLHEVLLQNKELMTLETELALEVDSRDNQLAGMKLKLENFADQEALLQELHRELDASATLAEEQNTWNQKLTVELESLELETAEQGQRVDVLEMREEAFSTHFTNLFSQYMQFITTNKHRLCATSNRSAKQLRKPTQYDLAISSGDVLELLRVFPALIEEYLASAMLGIEGQHNKAPSKKLTTQMKNDCLRSQPVEKPQPAKENNDPSPPLAALSPTTPTETQLELITEAFKKFKS